MKREGKLSAVTRALRFRRDSRPHRILEQISAGDLFVGFLLSGRSTKTMYRIARKQAQERYLNKQAVKKLKAYGFIQEVTRDGKSSFFVTQKGRAALHELYVHTTQLNKHPEKWDGMWRVIAYDFPEGERSARNSLRYILEKASYKQIQKSVWLSPYDSSLLEDLLQRHEVVKSHTLCLVVKKISNEKLYKDHFGLP